MNKVTSLQAYRDKKFPPKPTTRSLVVSLLDHVDEIKDFVYVIKDIEGTIHCGWSDNYLLNVIGLLEMGKEKIKQRMWEPNE